MYTWPANNINTDKLCDIEELFCSYTTMFVLTHRVMHICVGKLTIIGSDNGLLPGWHQAIIWTNAGALLIGPFGTNFSELLIAIETFSFKKMHLKISSAKWRPFCLGLNVLKYSERGNYAWFSDTTRNTVNFPWNTHRRYHIVCPWRWGIRRTWGFTAPSLVYIHHCCGLYNVIYILPDRLVL